MDAQRGCTEQQSCDVRPTCFTGGQKKVLLGVRGSAPQVPHSA